jgi:hypothetical protein
MAYVLVVVEIISWYVPIEYTGININWYFYISNGRNRIIFNLPLPTLPYLTYPTLPNLTNPYYNPLSSELYSTVSLSKNKP